MVSRQYGITLEGAFMTQIGKHPRKPWKTFVNASNKALANDDALDLMDGLLRYDHQERLTAKEAMQHPYFEGLAEQDAKMQ